MVNIALPRPCVRKGSLAEPPARFAVPPRKACLIIAVQGPVRLHVNIGESPRFKGEHVPNLCPPLYIFSGEERMIKNMERHLKICTSSK